MWSSRWFFANPFTLMKINNKCQNAFSAKFSSFSWHSFFIEELNYRFLVFVTIASQCWYWGSLLPNESKHKLGKWIDLSDDTYYVQFCNIHNDNCYNTEEQTSTPFIVLTLWNGQYIQETQLSENQLNSSKIK